VTWALKQTRRFARAYKKLDDNVARDVDAATEVVAADPTAGERKKGDLADLFVYEFRSRNQLYLLGYTVDNDVRLVYLEAIGSHENFYRDLKRG
jgi:mRNA-degrading endonuclease RelE of RelBE toxin-antitoxin system